ncbi:MAG: DoxX family membrane protein [Candidatus Acidiferrales bacterium]
MDDKCRAGFLIGLFLFASIFIASGLLHFCYPAPYARIIPPFLRWPQMLVRISGGAEILGGLGLLLQRFRRLAAYGLASLLVAVFPANIYMAVAHVPFPGRMGEPWIQWLRLPMQIPLIVWALYYAKPPRA